LTVTTAGATTPVASALPIAAPAAARHGANANLRRAAYVAIAVILLVFAIIEAAIVLPPALTKGLHVTWGMDLRMYLEHATRWLAGEGFYLPVQLAGPYVMEDVLGSAYPPVLLYLLVPFVWGLPWLVWWLVPLAVIGAAVVKARPSPWQWVALALILVYPRTWTIIVLGNPSMWAFAALSAGMVWKWPAVGVLLKATLAPFALVGIRSRSWWVGLGIALLLAVPFGAIWLDYLTVLLNAETRWGLGYTLGESPIALLLVVGLTRVRAPGARWSWRRAMAPG
jgi:hypothetical protein